MHAFRKLTLIGFAAYLTLAIITPAKAETTYPLRVGGYMQVTAQSAPTTFNAGYTFYSAAWPLAGDYPRKNFFQSGLYGTWMFPDSSRAYADPYQNIEGGLGWWYDRKFQTSSPKFSMGGVAFGGSGGNIANLSEWIFANGPGVGTTKGNGKYAIAQLSPSLLFPPDGLNLNQNTSGELFGYGYLALPLTQPKTTTAGQAIPTGNNSWTLFLSTENFKGPLAFFTPYYWSQVKLTFPEYANDLLDSRGAKPNRSIAMETPWSVQSRGSDVAPHSFVRSIPTYYPVDENGYSRLMHRLSVYNQSALWNATASWLANTGPPPSGTFAQAGTHIQSASASPLSWSVRNNSNQTIGNLNWNNLGISKSATPADVGYQWDTQEMEVVPWGEGSLVQLPQYHQGPVGASSSSTWTPISPSAIPEPAASALANASYTNTQGRSSHIIKDNDPVWTTPGPVAGPFRALLGDGSVVTYYWYRFADQPALLKADLTESEREQLQAVGEKIHREWKHDRDYIAPPEAGKLAGLDSGQFVSPPLGFEVGYVPIPWQQDWGGSVANPGSLNFTAIPSNPTVGQSFSVTVRADNASGNAQNVTSATIVQLSVASGNGILGGNTVATIPSGQSSVTITGITYSASETITLRASATCLSPSTSGNITFSAASSQINLYSRPATSVGITQASLPATLKCPGTNATVTVFWGTSNEGNRAADWQHSASLGSFNNVSNQSITHDLTGLQPKTTYYYIFRATGSSGTVWSPPVKSFTTLPLAPVITSHPASATRVIGSAATLSATATDAASYQWFKNGDPLSDGGTVSGATTATLSIANVSFADAASYHVVITNGSGTATSNTATLMAILPTTLTWDANTGTANAQDGGGNWLGGNNWLDGSTNVPWNDNHHAVIGTGGTGGTINPGSVTVNSLSINNFSGGSYTLDSGLIQLNGPFTYNATRATKITAALSGPGSIIKNGSGNLTLDGVTPNTYSGGTTVNAGTLILGTIVDGLSPDCSFAAGAGPVTLNSGAQINLHRVSIPNPLILNGGTIRIVNGWGATWAGPVTVNTNTTLTADHTFPFAISGNITGAGGLTKTGNHTLTLSGTNTYTGTTSVQAGRLAYQTAAAVAPGPVSIGSTQVVELNYTGTRNVQSLTINGTAQAPGTYGSTASSATNTSARFAGTGTLTVTGQSSVLYHGNGNTAGNAPVDASSPYAANASVIVLGQGTLSRTGFTFTGWNTAPNGTGTSHPVGSTFTITTSTTLYAQWQADPVTVTFHSNGGTSPVPETLQAHYSQPYGTLPTATRDDHSLIGWFTATSGGSLVTAATIVTANSDHILHAQWNALPLVNAGTDQSITATTSDPWAPAQLNPTAWYDASDASTIHSSGGAVSQWNDKSGHDRHLSQSTSARQPSTGNSTINGLNVLDFDQDYIFTPDGLSSDIYSVFMVTRNNVEITSSSSAQILLSTAGGGISTGDGYGSSTGAFDGEVLSVFDEDTTSFSKRQAASSATLSSIPAGSHLYTYALDTDWFIGFNGSDDLRDLTSGASRNPMGFSDSFSIGAGARSHPTNVESYFAGSVAEVVLLGTQVSAEDRQTLEGYLAHKWGLQANLPAEHPYKSAVPIITIATAILAASASDADGDPLVTTWSLVSGPGPVSIEDSTAVETAVTFRFTGTYVLRLTAFDGKDTTYDEVTITVTDGLEETYSDWIAGFDLGGKTGVDDDYNNDGVPNGLKYFFGIDPTVPSPGLSVLLPDVSDASQFSFTHPMRENLPANVQGEYRWTKDLATFHADGAVDADGTSVTFVRGEPVEGMVTVTATINGMPADRIFVVLIVNQIE